MGAPPPTGPLLPPLLALDGGTGGAWAKSENPEIISTIESTKIFFIVRMVFGYYFFFLL